jgi:hypothetical protein
MTIKIAIEKVEKHPEFLKWKEKNKDSFLSYVFTVLEENAQSDWQIGYYNKDNDKITTFAFKDNNITIMPDEEVFKKEDTKIVELNIEKVNISLDKALNYADEFQKKEFPNEESVKIIVILQNIPELNTIWNITYITKSFNVLNMKIDADNGKIVKHHISSMMDFRKE